MTLPGNGFSNGETITIAGASQSQYDGNFVIANVTANTFTYTISGSPASPATGTITACPTTAGATSFDANSILVGSTTATTAGGGTSSTTTPLLVTSEPIAGSSSLDNDIQTNVSSALSAAIATAGSTSLYSRITFNAPDLASLTSLTLRMQYDSGYVAYLNGVEIASSNAPATPTWKSAALEYRDSPVQATTYEDVDISAFLNSATADHLTATGNVLAIQSLMATPTDQDFYVSPAISADLDHPGRPAHLCRPHAGNVQHARQLAARPGLQRAARVLQPAVPVGAFDDDGRREYLLHDR